jgi:hypothetical protein
LDGTGWIINKLAAVRGLAQRAQEEQTEEHLPDAEVHLKLVRAHLVVIELPEAVETCRTDKILRSAEESPSPRLRQRHPLERIASGPVPFVNAGRKPFTP